MAMSMGKKYEEYVSSGEDSDWENDKKEVKPFSGQGVLMSSTGGVGIVYDKFEIDPEDYELISILRSNLEEQFKNSPSNDASVEVTFR